MGKKVPEPLYSPMGGLSGNTGNTNLSKEEDEKYGCLALKPSCFQCFNTIRCHVLWQCVFNFFEGFVVNGVINVVLVALEKRYALPSSKSGIIASSNDFGAIACVVAVGYFGEQRHKPKLMGAGILIMAVGCLVFSLPHFIGGEYAYTLSSGGQENATDNMCMLQDNVTNTCQESTIEHVTEDNDVYFGLLMLGNILLGIGAAPMFTIGLSYIDENCKPKMSSFYISWTFCAAAIGVAIGYVVGGQTLGLFVDIDKVDLNSVALTPMDPQWVGAWWIAPLIAMAGLLFVTMPLCGYPKRLPSYKEVQKHRKSEVHGGQDEMTAQANFGKSWKDFPKSILILIRNPTYVFICCGAAMEALVIGGMASFGAKLMQEKFNIDLPMAGTIMGIITIPGSGGGMLLGGYLVKKFRLKCRGIIRMCSGFMLLALCFAPFMLAHCENDPVAGINKPYINETSPEGLISDCNIDCDCTSQGFEPICSQGVVYFSPCHAGCSGSVTEGDVKMYGNCSCYLNPGVAGVSLSHGNWSEYHMKAGLCHGKCPWLYVFSALFLIVMILTFATMSPGVAALFRCVPDKQRSVALGVNLLFVRLVGTTPGPILLGSIIDSSCTVWQDTCGIQGTCWVYDRYDMGMRIMLWFIGLKLCGFTFFLIASCVYKPPLDDRVNVQVGPVASNPIASVKGRYDVNNKYYGSADDVTKL